MSNSTALPIDLLAGASFATKVFWINGRIAHRPALVIEALTRRRDKSLAPR